MKITTLGALLKASRKAGAGLTANDPLQARSWLYGAMGNYFCRSVNFLEDDSWATHESVTMEMGSLIHHLAIDAQTVLTPEKFHVLEDYPLTEEHEHLELNKDLFREMLGNAWGTEDTFMFRVSGGLIGSYMKALSTLKPQARALGHDLSAATTAYVKGL